MIVMVNLLEFQTFTRTTRGRRVVVPLSSRRTGIRSRVEHAFMNEKVKLFQRLGQKNAREP
ncbi:MAG: hypothetical protein ABI422_05055 [Sphingomicrobium sp.]